MYASTINFAYKLTEEVGALSFGTNADGTVFAEITEYIEKNIMIGKNGFLKIDSLDNLSTQLPRDYESVVVFCTEEDKLYLITREDMSTGSFRYPFELTQSDLQKNGCSYAILKELCTTPITYATQEQYELILAAQGLTDLRRVLSYNIHRKGGGGDSHTSNVPIPKIIIGQEALDPDRVRQINNDFYHTTSIQTFAIDTERLKVHHINASKITTQDSSLLRSHIAMLESLYGIQISPPVTFIGTLDEWLNEYTQKEEYTNYHSSQSFLLTLGASLATVAAAVLFLIAILAIVAVLSIPPVGIAFVAGAGLVAGGLAVAGFYKSNVHKKALIASDLKNDSVQAKMTPDAMCDDLCIEKGAMQPG